MEILEVIIVELEKIGIIGLILIWAAFLIGIKYPDWDFKMKLKHRNMLTHSPLILWGMIYFYHSQNDVEVFRFFIMGFAMALGLHMVFDSFPRGWSRGALIYFPIVKVGLGVKLSRSFIYLSAISSIFLAVKLSKTYFEVIVLFFLGLYKIIKDTTREEKFFRPFFFFSIVLIGLGAIKYDEIGNGIINIVHFFIKRIEVLL